MPSVPRRLSPFARSCAALPFLGLVLCATTPSRAELFDLFPSSQSGEARPLAAGIQRETVAYSGPKSRGPSSSRPMSAGSITCSAAGRR